MIKEKTKAPTFKLPSTSRINYSLTDSLGKYVVIYFYPKDDLISHNKFKDKYKIKINLLSDVSKKVLKTYKVWGKKNFMGREFMGVTRSTFLIDKRGIILKIWHNVKVKEHAKDVLNFLNSISKN